MPEFKLSTPVAFIIFNRPDTTERVFTEIAKAKPTKLLVVADGARTDKVGEAEKVAATRAIIDRVDWDCEVLTNYSDVNLGCKHRVSSGIDWVFEQVEEAIILEDDCLPDPTFFRFCHELLEYYRYDQRIGMIKGNNFLFGQQRNNDSYYFSKYCIIWGWATWRDRWINTYDVKITKWPAILADDWLPDLLGDSKQVAYWRNIFDRTYNNLIDTWDYQWFFTNLVEGRLSITPHVNLISNIGVGVDATHTKDDCIVLNIPTKLISFPLTHPLGVFQNSQDDKRVDQIFFHTSFLIRFRNKALRIRKKLTDWMLIN